ncbi:MAG: UDP-N-acetylmuramoyl-L-alanine--D-glutamate ligase [Oscillochloridaceae bacterium umkhey_bin13]
MDFVDKRVLVMGLGVHGGGLGVARWLLQQGATVTVTDLATPEALAVPVAALNETAAALGTTVTYRLGSHDEVDLRAADLLVINPAVRPDSPWLALAADLGVAVETEMTLFLRRCPGPIFGITGTKGKTTTALMLAAMLREQHPDTVVAGNLRVSALEALAEIGPQTPVVLELSSFQLERLGAAGLSPAYSLVTNFSDDHLNWHGSRDAYAAAKRQIYWHQATNGVVALNAADDGLIEYFPLYDGVTRHQGRTIWVAAGPHWSAARPRIPQPTVRAADTTVEWRGEQVIWYDPLGHCGPPVPLYGEVLFHAQDIQLPGAHNRYNAMLAAALARAYGVTAPAIQTALRNFRGVEHRLELVRELDGVRYINDTTATNPAAALVALEALAPPLVLLAGGADKNLSFTALGAAIRQRVQSLVLLAGSATEQIQAAVAAAPGPEVPILGPFDDLEAAVHAARGQAQAGASVLLSPGCASFGMFRNEFHRGEEFRRIVAALAPEGSKPVRESRKRRKR